MTSDISKIILDNAVKWSGPIGPLGHWPPETQMKELALSLGPDAAPQLAELVLAMAAELDDSLGGLLDFALIFAECHAKATLAAFVPLLSATSPTVVIHILSATKDPDVLPPLRAAMESPQATEDTLVQAFDALTVLASQEAREILDSVDTTQLSKDALREYRIALSVLSGET